MLDVLESRKGQQLIIILFIYFSFADFQDHDGSCTDIGVDFGCGVCNDEVPRLAQRMGEPTKYISIDHTKPAGLPSSNSTRSCWADSSPDASPLAREGSTGPLTTDADVCITGSGITGVGVAYHLSQTVEMSFLRRETFVRMSPMLPILSTFGW